MAVIFNLATLNLTAPTNCQVRSVPCIYLYPTGSTSYHPKVLYIINFVSMLSSSSLQAPMRASCLLILLLFQILAYMTFALSSLLIILRMWVFRLVLIGRYPEEALILPAHQHRHLEQD